MKPNGKGWKISKFCTIVGDLPPFNDVYGNLNKRFSDAGLKDALIQSSIIAEESIDSALRGNCYNRGVQLYKTAYESLLRLVLLEVMTDLSPEIENHLSTLFKSFEESPQETIQSALDKMPYLTSITTS